MARELNIKITVDSSQAKRELASVDTSVDKVEKTFTRLATAVAAGFSLQMVVGFGQKILAAADEIKKMADQTDLSVGAVQRLQYIAGQSGTSVQSLVSAVQNLQLRLGDDSSGAAGALKRMNINVDEFRRLDPYEQLIRAAEGVRAIKDPTERAQVAADLFGKTWKEILPAIKSDMRALGNEAPIMADKVVDSMDRIGDILKGAEQRWVSWGANIALAIEEAGFRVGDFFSKFNPANMGATNSQLLAMEAALNDKTGIARALQSIPPQALKTNEGLKAVTYNSEQLVDIDRKLTLEQMRHEQAVKAEKKAADELAESLKKVVDVNRAIISQGTGAFDLNSIAIRTEISHLEDLLTNLEKVEAINTAIALQNDQRDENLAALEGELRAIGKVVNQEFVGPLEEAVQVTTTLTERITKGLAPAILGAFQGGGNVGQTIGGFFGGELGTAVGKRLATSIGGALGSTLGSVIPGLGTLVGGALGSLFGKLFDDPEKAINPIREAFVQAAGGLAALDAKAGAANITLQHLLDARNPKQYQRAIEELNAAFQLHDQAMQTLDETLKRYNLTQDDVGNPARAQMIHQQAVQYVQDWGVLRAAGVDYGVIVERAGTAFIDMVQDARQAGIALPESLRPMIQRAVEMGLILDDNGEAFGSLEAAGITFADSIGEQFDTLIGKIDELVESLSVGLAGGLTEAQRNAMDFQTWLDDHPFSAHFSGFGYTNPYAGLPGTENLHSGGLIGGLQRAHSGLAFDEVPIIGLRGEGVLNRGAMRRIGGAAGLNRLNAGGSASGPSVNVVVNVDGYLDSPEARRHLTRLVSDTIMDELQVRGGQG